MGAKIQAEYAVSDMVVPGIKISYDNANDAWYNNKVAATDDAYALNTETGAIDLTPGKAAVAATSGAVINPYCQLNFAAGDVKIGFSYDMRTSTWSIPVEFELSY
jgi:hypothetical protein